MSYDFRSTLQTVVWMAMIVCAGPVSAASTPSCADIGDPNGRLACYDQLAECITTHDADARLACYDGAQAPRLSTDDGATRSESRQPPPTAAEAPAASTSVNEDAAFAVPGARRDEEKEEPRLVARIVEVQEGPRGLDYLTLDNGQVWRELSRGRIDFEPGAEVEIRPGILGSVNLRVEGHDGYVKVRRVE